MGKFVEWEIFRDTATELIGSNPFISRLVVKYNHKKDVCIMKVTDDKKWIKTKIVNIKDFTKIEQFIKVASKILSNQTEDKTAMEEEKPLKKKH
ncbi:hypothetical protein ABPG72_018940 [Tetrahymena utriculariae]